jgi:hypothetical protein
MSRETDEWKKIVEKGAPLLWEAAMNTGSREEDSSRVVETDPSKMDLEQKTAYLMEKHRVRYYGPRRADG